ncbi:MAG: hypothetical protein U0412_14750 [Nitrospira sp.]
MKDVEQVRAELEKLYHTAGYPTVLVNLLEQMIENGAWCVSSRRRTSVVHHGHGQRVLQLAEHPKQATATTPGVLYEPTFVKELSAVNGNPDLNVAPVPQARRGAGYRRSGVEGQRPFAGARASWKPTIKG